MCKGVVIHLLTWSNDSFYCMQFDYLKSTSTKQTSPQQPPTTLPPQTHIKITKRKKKQKQNKIPTHLPPPTPLKKHKKKKSCDKEAFLLE